MDTNRIEELTEDQLIELHLTRDGDREDGTPRLIYAATVYDEDGDPTDGVVYLELDSDDLKWIEEKLEQGADLEEIEEGLDDSTAYGVLAALETPEEGAANEAAAQKIITAMEEKGAKTFGELFEDVP